MIINLILLLLLIHISYSTPKCQLPFPVELKYKTVKEVGKKYRKTDVIIHIPVALKFVKIKQPSKEKPAVDLNLRIEDKTAITELKALEPLKSDLLLIQPIEKGFVYEEAHVRRIISRTPKIEEIFIVYPMDVKKNYISFPLPSISVGEKLIVEYKFEGKLGEPYIRYIYPKENLRKIKKPVFINVKYSFIFKYAKATVNDENVKNIKNLLKQLKNLGLNPKIEIIGFADGQTKNPKRNEEIAKKRALEIAKRIFPEEFKSCITSYVPIIKINR